MLDSSQDFGFEPGFVIVAGQVRVNESELKAGSSGTTVMAVILRSGRSLKLCRGFFRSETHLQTAENIVFCATPFPGPHRHTKRLRNCGSNIPQNGIPSVQQTSAFTITVVSTIVSLEVVGLAVVATTEDVPTRAMTEHGLNQNNARKNYRSQLQRADWRSDAEKLKLSGFAWSGSKYHRMFLACEIP